ncbi:MAG: efflux RND transporter permease subunit, partial [bacterium]
MAASVCCALAGAVALAFTVVPVLGSLFLSGESGKEEDRATALAVQWYRSVVMWSLTRRRPLLAGVLGLGVIAGVVSLRMGGEFMPQLDEGSILMQMFRPNSIGIDRSLAMQKRSELIIREFPEVAHVFARLGTQEIAVDPMGVNVSDTFIMLKPRGEWPKARGRRRRTKAELAEAIRKSLAGRMLGQNYLVTQPIQMRFNEMLGAATADIVVKVFGPDLGTLTDLTTQVRDVLARTRGAGDVEFSALGGTLAIQIEPDREALRRVGATVADVNEAVAAALGGREAGVLYDAFGRPVPIVVRLPEEQRESLEGLRALPVRAAGGTVARAAVARIKESEQVSTISREFGKRRMAVLVNPRDRDLAGYVREARERIAREIVLPEGYYVQWGGQFQNLA